MSFVLTLLLALAATPFEFAVERAFAQIETNNWTAAAADLDEAYAQEPAVFAANNFHYLRGRLAENQDDWQRARSEFASVESNNPLYALALWRAAEASAKMHDDAAAMQYLQLLPANFPPELKMRIAREAGGSLALQLYERIPTREARYERSITVDDYPALWTLVREDNDDDTALNAARVLAPMAATTADRMQLAQVFANHRQFPDALSMYQQAIGDPLFEPDARFQIGRVHYLQENYAQAIADYRTLAKDFAETDWEKNAEYEIAGCYWRLGDYASSEKAYVDYIRKYGRAGLSEAATRNLVDIYRVLGQNQKALSTLDRALARRPGVASRQVFLFTKAKILYTEKRYSAALSIFRQLGRMRLRSAPGATTAEEAAYFEALCLSKLGQQQAARAIWRKLSRDEFSYYAQRAAAKLGKDAVQNSTAPCPVSGGDFVLDRIETDLAGLRHPLRSEIDPTSDPVSELVFLRLWDDAAFWMDWSSRRPAPRQAAEIFYLAGRYNRSVALANKLGKDESALPLIYPAGYRNLICEAARDYKVDPFWLHAIIWQESKYNPNSRSGAAARGLMQFIPETARMVASSIGMPDLTIEKLYDPAVSIQLGAAYWSSLLEQFKSPEMALAAYNGGPINVERWRSKSSDPELFVADIGFTETKKYVMLVFGARAAYAFTNSLRTDR